MRLFSLLSNFDLLGHPIQLKIKGNETYKTIFGGILSLIVIALLISLAINLLIQINNRTNPSTSLSTSYNSESKINLANQFPLIFLVTDISGNLIKEQSIYNLVGYIFNYNTTNPLNTYSKLIFLNFTKCTNELIKTNYRGNLESTLNQLPTDFYFSNLLCLIQPDNSTDYSIINNYGSSSFQFLQFSLTRCDNKTTNNTYKSKDIIDQVLSNAQFTILTPDTYFDNLNYESPGVPYINYQTFIVSTNLYKRFFIYLKPVNYLSDNGLVLSDIKNYTYFQIDKLTQEFNLPGVQTIIPNTFANFCFTIQTNVYNIYSRQYLSITQVLANLGGVFNALMVLCLIINYSVEKSLKRIEIFDSLCTKSFNEKNNQSRIEKISKYHDEINTHCKIMNNFTEKKKIESSIDKSDNLMNNSMILRKKVENNFDYKKKLFIFEYTGIEKLFEIKFSFLQKIFSFLRNKNQKEKTLLAERFYDEIMDINFILGNLLEFQLANLSGFKT